MIINQKGNIISHINKDYVYKEYNPIEAAKKDTGAKELASVISKAKENKTGMEKYTFNKETRYTAYAPIKDTSWSILVTDLENEIMSDMDHFKMTSFVMIFIIIIIILLATYFLGNNISKPITEISNFAKTIATLDIRENIPDNLLKQKNEIGVLSNSFQTLIVNLRVLVTKMGASAEHVKDSSTTLSEVTEQTSKAALDTSRVIDEIAKGADEQSSMTQSGAEMVQQLEEVVNNEVVLLNTLNDNSNNVVTLIEDGLKEVKALTEITRQTDEATKMIYDGISKTNGSSSKIGEASSVIASISEQTNLLALNAAIEAARAGEHGKGFSVVADEIRKLAEQSNASTKQIDIMVKELQQNSNEAVETMEKVIHIITEQKASVTSTDNKYKSIFKAITDSVESIQSLNASSVEINNKKDQILDIMQNLSAIAQQNAASTEEVSASVEEQTASLEEISNSSSKLNNLVTELNSLITKFKV
ncbi:MAG TPA: methyl-accepting chemotaxis protein [Ruminiclostridium sp.]|nr:methyl-accepting chemotaxis protein [Ruminiclostridium sp.]